MKSKHQPIPQAEFGFTSETFNLGQQSAPVAATGPKIVAEMTADERAQFEAKRDNQPAFGSFEQIADEERRAFGSGKDGTPTVSDAGIANIQAMARLAASNAEKIREQYKGWKIAETETTQPGLAPGSYWSVQAMRKAIATGGGR